MDYSKFIVAPVTIYLAADAKAYNEDPVKLKSIADAFHSQIVSALQEQGTVVDKPGDGVLLITVAITDVYNIKSSVKAAKGLLEAEFVDTKTRERIVALMTSQKGIVFAKFADLLKNKFKELTKTTQVYTSK